MKEQLHIGQVQVPYEIEWSEDRNTIGISMKPDRELIVTAPPSATLDDTWDALDQRKLWILKKLKQIDDQEDPPANREYLSGEKYLYRGRRYRLRVFENETEELEFTGSQFHLKLSDVENDPYREQRGAELFKDWYWKKAEQELPQRVDHWLEQIDVSLETTEIFDSKRHWGQQSDDAIKLNWCLVRAPVRIQDYVIVHELVHRRTRLHDETFWNQVGTLLPNYEEHREWLRVKGGILKL